MLESRLGLARQWGPGKKGKAPWPIVGEGSPRLMALGLCTSWLSLSLRNGAQRFCPASCCSQPAEEEDALGSHSPSFRALKQQREGAVTDRASRPGCQKREAFFLSSFRFHRASLPNSSGDMAKTLEKSSADKCLSSLMRSTPGGSLVRPLLVTTSIS